MTDSYLSDRESKMREGLKAYIASSSLATYVDPHNYIAVLDRLEEALKENEELKKRSRQDALREISRLGQEIEEPSEINRLCQENKELRQRIAELENE